MQIKINKNESTAFTNNPVLWNDLQDTYNRSLKYLSLVSQQSSFYIRK